MIDGVIYVSTMYNQVAALDAEPASELWRYDSEGLRGRPAANGKGFVHRGVVAWRDGDRLPHLPERRYKLIQLDAKTGGRCRRSARTASSI